MSNEPLAQLSREGVAIWLDDLSRDRLSTGSLKSLIDEKHGVTTNPSIFQAAISKSSLYDDHLRAAAKAGEDAHAAVRRFTTDDVRNAADLFATLAEQSDNGDGRVSIEVDPQLAQTPKPPSHRHMTSGPRSTGRTSTSRSRRLRPACPPSPRPSQLASAST